MDRILRPVVLVAMILAIPIVPFLLFGGLTEAGALETGTLETGALETTIERWLDEDVSSVWVAAAVVGLLASDVFLPIPSSIVITLAGSTLGFLVATAAAWLGMTLGAVVAFVLARRFGRRAACRFCGEEEMARVDRLCDRFGPMVLVLTRPVPVLAEATILFLGTTDLPWRRFVLPIGLSNLGIAAVYAALGERVQFPIALGAAIALPLLAATIARIAWPKE